MGKRFSLKTKAGCSRLLAIFIALILVCGFLGQLVQTNGGKIKIESVTIDARGAQLNGELYYPAGTTGNDKMPAIIVNHGGGCIYGTMKNIAEEIARRGYVVFNVSAYGSGLSEQPDYDDAGQGINGFYQSIRAVEGQQSFLPTATPMGLHDAINFVRSLEMVDKENIGIVGHSMGAYRISAATTMDCGYLSLNDTMINVLYDEFGQSFTEEEIAMDADELAAARLNEDQLAHYYTIKEAEEEIYNTRIKAEIILGIGYEATTSYPETVQVAGYDVKRNVQTNICYMSGGFDATYNLGTNENTKNDWYATEDLVMGDWYDIDDNSASCTSVGNIYSTSALTNEDVAKSISDKTSRIFIVTPNETHSKEFFSSKTNTAIIQYFEQTLGYNNGYLAEGSANALDASSNIWGWRVLFNTIAMFSMIGMLIALAGLLVNTDTFKPSIVEVSGVERPSFSKRQNIVFFIIANILGFGAIYFANAKGLFIFNPSRMWPLGRGCSLAMVYIICLALIAVIMTAIQVVIYRKKTGKTGLASLNIGIGGKNFLKHIAMAAILLIAGYVALAVSQYFFGQEFRLWMTAFSEMKADYWYIALRFFIVLFPLYILISIGVNYNARNEGSETKDDILCVLTNSVGLWLCCLLNILIALSRPYQGLFFSSFICSYQMVTIVPMTTFLNRKIYRITKSIWVSAALCAILVAWTLVCTLGINDVWYGQTWLGDFLFK